MPARETARSADAASGEHAAAVADSPRRDADAEDGIGRDAAVTTPLPLPGPQDPSAAAAATVVTALGPAQVVEAGDEAAASADGAVPADAVAGAGAPGHAASHAAALASGTGLAPMALPADESARHRATPDHEPADIDPAAPASAAPATLAHRAATAAGRDAADEHALVAMPPTEARTFEAVGLATAAGARHEAPGGVADRATGALPSFAAELAQAARHPGAPEPAAPVEVRAPVPVDAPDFLPRLGGELAILARDGVQEARVQLHPVELGPIAVQITLDGQAAQVHLAVDNAHTRALLETAMPTLAAALREQGLTLTGGGVFEQSRQGQGGQGERTPGRADRSVSGDGALDEAHAGTPQPARNLRRAGGLDLYA